MIMNKMNIKVIKSDVSTYSSIDNNIEHYKCLNSDMVFSRYINNKEYGIEIIKKFTL